MTCFLSLTISNIYNENEDFMYKLFEIRTTSEAILHKKNVKIWDIVILKKELGAVLSSFVFFVIPCSSSSGHL